MQIDMHQWDVGSFTAFETYTVCFFGEVMDERGRTAVDLVTASSDKAFNVRYSTDDQCLFIDDQIVQCHELRDWLECVDSSSVLIEATTLGFPELALIISAYFPLRGCRIAISYIEPGEYKAKKEDLVSDREFLLSDKLIGYEGIPTLAKELDGHIDNCVVFFVGFEPARLSRAFEEQPISPAHCSLVFGVPPYRLGWETNSYHNNIRCLSEHNLRNRIFYCAADNPRSAYEKLLEIKKSLGDGQRLFVAPIGTKPLGIGAAIFGAVHSDDVGLLYDHPVKSPDRSRGCGPLHIFAIIEV